MLFFTPIFRPVAKILNTDNKKEISLEWYIAVILIHLIQEPIKWSLHPH